MALGNLGQFEEVKAALGRNEPVPNLQIQLNLLSIRFAEISDGFRVLDDTEQQVRASEFLQIQYQFHDIAMAMISKLMEEMFGSEQEQTTEQIAQPVAIEPITNDEQEQVEMQHQTELDGTAQANATDLEGAQSLASQQLDRGNESQSTTWAEQMEEEQLQYPAPPFEEYIKIMEPIFSLEKISRVTEQAIHLVLTTVTNAAEMAREKNYSIQHDQGLIIMAIQRKLDITSQQLWRFFRRQRALNLDLLMEFLADRAQNIDPAERLMIHVQPIPMVGTAQGASCSGAIPRTTTRANVPHDFFVRKEVDDGKPAAKKSKLKCPRCSGEHILRHCEAFLSSHLQAKASIVAKAKLCRNCFSAHHNATICPVGPCKHCDVKHNSLLCPKSQSNRN